MLTKNIKDKLRAVFKAYSEITKNKINKVDKTKLLELLSEKIIKIGFFAIPTS